MFYIIIRREEHTHSVTMTHCPRKTTVLDKLSFKIRQWSLVSQNIAFMPPLKALMSLKQSVCIIKNNWNKDVSSLCQVLSSLRKKQIIFLNSKYYCNQRSHTFWLHLVRMPKDQILESKCFSSVHLWPLWQQALKIVYGAPKLVTKAS